MNRVYYYKCLECGASFEQEQPFGASAYTEGFCPHCGHRGAIQRLICKTSFVLKGKCWAKDSYGLRGTTE